MVDIVQLGNLVQELRIHDDYPAVSILMPTSQVMPDKLDNRIILKDAVAEIKSKLLACDLAPHKLSSIIERIERLVEKHDFSRCLEGLALFVGGEIAQIIALPFTVTQSSYVGAGFHVAPLIRGLQAHNNYLVLQLNVEVSRLYELNGDKLVEVITPLSDAQGNPLQGFPIDDVRQSNFMEVIGKGDRDAKHLDAHTRRYWELVDSELGKMLHKKDLKVIICGVEKNLASFEQATKHGRHIVGHLLGNYRDHEDELVRAVLQVISEYRRRNIQDSIKLFVEAEGQLKQASGLQHTWLMASEGRIHIMLLEEGFHPFGLRDVHNPAHVFINSDPDSMDGVDLGDELVNQVFRTSGQVVFVDKDDLKAFGRIGAILRY